jgi:hypothetical protein
MITDWLAQRHYKHSKNKMAQQIPIIVARLIDDGVGLPFFRAFSPFEFFPKGNHAIQQQELIERVINWMRVNNYIFHGPYHIDMIVTPLARRGCVCYFSTYNHMIDNNDMLIHPSSPIYFNAAEAEDYRATQLNLTHHSCLHEFV